MKNIITKLIKIVGITALAGLFLWGGAYLVSPKVKEWTNTNIFHIEQTIEDETNNDETGDETPEDETGDETGESNVDGLPDPDSQNPPVESEE